MTKENLLTEIAKEKEQLERELQNKAKQEKLDFLTDYINKNHIEKFTDLKNADAVNMAIAYCLSANPNFSIQELQETFHKLEPFTKIKSYDMFTSIFTSLEKLYRGNSLSDIEEVMYEKNTFMKAVKIMKILDNAHLKGNIEFYTLVLRNEEGPLLPYFKLLDKDKKTARKVISIIGTIISAKETMRKKTTPQAAKLSKEGIKVEDVPEDVKKIMMNIEYNIAPLLEELSMIKYRIETLKSEIKETGKKIRKELDAYKKIEKELLRKEPKGIIRTHHQLTAQIQNETIKKKVLQFIYSWNEKYYQEIESTYQQLTENSVARYQALLQEYGISKNQYRDKDVMRNSLKETKEMLEILTSLGIEEKEEIINILKTSSKAYLDQISSIINDGYLSREFIKQDPSILQEENNFYSIFKANKESIEEKKINPMMLAKDEKSWQISPDQVKRNLDILEQYQLLGSMSKTKQYTFLGKSDIESIIDTILELGLEPLLEQGLDLLNYDAKKWLRMRVLKELEEMPSDSKTITEVLELEKDQFFIPEDIIENYIFRESPKSPEITTQEENVGEEEIRKQLNSFQQTKRTYNIDGVILSKNKVDRNLRNVVQEPISTRDKIYLSLVDNTILQEQELQQIEKAIQSPVKKFLIKKSSATNE